VSGEVDTIRQRHVTIAETLLSRSNAGTYVQQLDADCRDILGILHAVHLTRSASPPIRDVVAGFGEIWSTRLFAQYFSAITRRPGTVHWIDARDVIEVEWRAVRTYIPRTSAPAPRGPSAPPGPTHDPHR